MKSAWLVLIITAVTDFGNTAATGLIAAMMATGTAELPTRAAIIVICLGGVVAAGRTIQQALKATPANTAELKGQAVVTTTVTPDSSVTTKPPVKP